MTAEVHLEHRLLTPWGRDGTPQSPPMAFPSASTALPLVLSIVLVARPAVAGAARGAVTPPQLAPTTPSDTSSHRDRLDSLVATATFDSAWRTVAASFAHRGISRPDWDGVSRELRPAAARARTDSALRAVIATMLGRLGESHFAVLPGTRGVPASGEVAPSASGSTLGSASIDPRIVDGRLVAWRVAGHAARAGLTPGWTLERIGEFVVPAVPHSRDGENGERRLSVLTFALRALRGAPGTAVRITGRDELGVRRTLDVVRDSVRGPVSRFGNLPALPAGLTLSRRVAAGGACIGVIAFEYWLPAAMPAIDRAIDSVRTCSGIVLDLRGNLGGVAGMVMGVAGHFVPEPRSLGAMRTRGEELRFMANPRRVTSEGEVVEPFAGPLAILVDELSASTSEIFAAGLQALGRGRVFGERTAGQALPAMATRLPNGDVLMHVVADFVAADGSRIEGRGVIPDELVPIDWANVGAGRDAPLAAAMRWIERTRPRAAASQ